MGHDIRGVSRCITHGCSKKGMFMNVWCDVCPSRILEMTNKKHMTNGALVSRQFLSTDQALQSTPIDEGSPSSRRGFTFRWPIKHKATRQVSKKQGEGCGRLWSRANNRFRSDKQIEAGNLHPRFPEKCCTSDEVNEVNLGQLTWEEGTKVRDKFERK